jgi:hypothetical protein
VIDTGLGFGLGSGLGKIVSIGLVLGISAQPKVRVSFSHWSGVIVIVRFKSRAIVHVRDSVNLRAMDMISARSSVM